MQPNTKFQPPRDSSAPVSRGVNDNRDLYTANAKSAATTPGERNTATAAIVILAVLVVLAVGYAWYSKSHNATYNENLTGTAAPVATDNAVAPSVVTPSPDAANDNSPAADATGDDIQDNTAMTEAPAQAEAAPAATDSSVQAPNAAGNRP